MENQAPYLTPRPKPVAGAGGREDCWSEGATETLINAWGDRYLQLNRGNLRQKDWREVADAVNGRHNGVKPRRTDIQCKNRVDTLKKKYKLERAKPVPSKWPFYCRLDHLIGANGVTRTSINRTNPSPSVRKPATVTFTVNSRAKQSPYPNPNPNPNPNAVICYGASSSKSKLNSSGSNNSSHDGSGGEFAAADDRGRKHMMEGVDFSEETACKELARAILRFGEIYERVESSKQQQIMELEKERMEFTKDLEFKRINMFMEAQLELQKMKQPTKYAPGEGEGKKL